jgi:hypothetical protein
MITTVNPSIAVQEHLWQEYFRECIQAKQDPAKFLSMIVNDGLDNLLHRDPRLLHCFRQKKLKV